MVQNLMHIVYIDWACNPDKPGESGMSDLVWSLANHLVEEGHRVTVVAPYFVPPNGSDHRVQLISFREPPVGYRNIVGHLWLAARSARIAADVPNADVIHVMEYLTTAIGAQWQRQKPWVLTTPGNINERLAHVNHFDLPTTLAYRIAAWLTVRSSCQILATSESMRYWWSRTGADPNHLSVVPLGVDCDRFRPAASSSDSDGDPPTVLFVGRLEGENGLRTFLESLVILQRTGLSVKAKVVGTGRDFTRGRMFACRHAIANSITWLGNVPFSRLHLVYQDSDIFVMPRLSHVTPRTLFEAMATGLPVVASRIGGIEDFIDDGDTGLLFDPRDSLQLALSIQTLMRDRQLMLSLGENARNFAESKLDWSVVGKQILRQYREIST